MTDKELKQKNAELERELDSARLEIDRLQRDCAEAYQVIGCFPDVSPSENDIERALDNLSAAVAGDPRPHDDLLPWPSEEIAEQRSE